MVDTASLGQSGREVGGWPLMTRMVTSLEKLPQVLPSRSRSPWFSGFEFPHEELRDSIHSHSFWLSLGALRSSEVAIFSNTVRVFMSGFDVFAEMNLLSFIFGCVPSHNGHSKEKTKYQIE